MELLAEIDRLRGEMANHRLDLEWPIVKERDQLRAEVAVARERLGPAGYKLLEEVRKLRAENEYLQHTKERNYKEFETALNTAKYINENQKLRAENESNERRIEIAVEEAKNNKDLVIHYEKQLENVLKDEHSAVSRGNRLAQENQKLRERVEKLREACRMYPCDTDCGPCVLCKALDQDDVYEYPPPEDSL